MSTRIDAWDVEKYSKFLDERTRPALELVERVRLNDVTAAVDLGCGPGNSTLLIKKRWPAAKIVGVDSSEAMLLEARKDHPEIEFVHQDMTRWQPDSSVDLVFSNAALQWAPDHDKLIPRLVSLLSQRGVLALQMPHNHQSATHVSMRQVACENSWSVDLSSVRRDPPVLTPQTYYDLLKPIAGEIDIWQTTYFHVMNSISAIVEWLRSTGLRPFLSPLSDEERERFLSLYEEKLGQCFEKQSDGKVLLPFPRLFIVAYRAA